MAHGLFKSNTERNSYMFGSKSKQLHPVAGGGPRWRNDLSAAGRGQLDDLKRVPRVHVKIWAVMAHGLFKSNTERN